MLEQGEHHVLVHLAFFVSSSKGCGHVTRPPARANRRQESVPSRRAFDGRRLLTQRARELRRVALTWSRAAQGAADFPQTVWINHGIDIRAEPQVLSVFCVLHGMFFQEHNFGSPKIEAGARPKPA